MEKGSGKNLLQKVFPAFPPAEMAKARNNIERLPAKLRIQIARWMLNSIGYDEIRRRVADAEPTAAVVHNSSFRAFAKSAEYRELRERMLFEDEQNQKLQQYWHLVNSEDGLDSAVKGTLFLLLRKAHDAAGATLDTKEVASLIRSLTSLQKAETYQDLADSRRRIEAIEAEHAAEVATLQAEIARLRTEIENQKTIIANAGLNTEGQAGDEFSEAEKARARKLYGLK